MATLTLTEVAPEVAPAVSPWSDADLLTITAMLVSAMPGSLLPQPLSVVIEDACWFNARGGLDRAARLELLLAEYLHARHALLRTADVSSAGLDAWAGRAGIDVVRSAIFCCARHAGGAR